MAIEGRDTKGAIRNLNENLNNWGMVVGRIRLEWDIMEGEVEFTKGRGKVKK